MKKKFLSVIAICAILSSVAAPYCSASGNSSSSMFPSSSSSTSSSFNPTSSTTPGPTNSSTVNKNKLSSACETAVHFASMFTDSEKQNADLTDQNINLTIQNVKLKDEKFILTTQNAKLTTQNANLETQIKKLQKRHPFMRLVKIAGGIYIVYDVYNKNSSEDNFDFVKTFAKESANQLKSNISCEDATPLCIVGQTAASLAGYVKGFTSAEACVLTNGSLCPEAVKDSAHAYLSDDQFKTLSFIK